MKAPEKVRSWRVTHPEHGEIMVCADTAEEAGVEAARLWGVPWTKIAAMLDAEDHGVSWRVTCPACSRVFPSATERAGRCPACEKLHRQRAAKFAEGRKVDRRIR